MEPDRLVDVRGRPDRRRRPTTLWDAIRLRHPRRRRRLRRGEEKRSRYFVDLIDTPTFVMAVLLLVLTVVDGAITLVLLGSDCEEVNPAMVYLLGLGPMHFLLGKYLLTCAGLPFLIIFRHFTLFRTGFRVGYLLPVFIALYLVLLGYQVALLGPYPGRGHLEDWSPLIQPRTSTPDFLSAFSLSTRRGGGFGRLGDPEGI